MKPFRLEKTIIDPYSPMEKLTLCNDEYNIDIWVDNDRDTFSTLELKEMAGLVNDIGYLELEFDEGNILYFNPDEFNTELHYPANRIEMKDKDNNTIFKILVEHEENQIVQLVHLKVTHN